jgi:hypothetical protein
MNKVYKHAVLISSASSVPENLSYSAVEEATQLAEEHLSAAEPRSASLSPPETFRTRGLPRLDRLLHRPPPLPDRRIRARDTANRLGDGLRASESAGTMRLLKSRRRCSCSRGSCGTLVRRLPRAQNRDLEAKESTGMRS